MAYIVLIIILALTFWVLKIYFHLKAIQVSQRKKWILFNDGLSMNFWEIIRCMPFPFWGGSNNGEYDFNKKGNIALLLFYITVFIIFMM
jgi:hypothetical protein